MTETTGSGTRMSVLHNASLLAGATLASRALMFALGIVLARALGAEEYGRYAVALALGAVLQPVADLGLTPYLSREVARDHGTAESALPALVHAKVTLTGGVLVLALGIAALVTGGDLFAVLAVMVIASLVDGLSLFAYGYFQGRETMGFEARTTVGATTARAIGGIVLALVFERLGPVVAWILLVALVQAGVAAWRLTRAVHTAQAVRPRRRAGRVDWRSVISMGLIAIFVMIYLRIDSVLLGWLDSERAVGLYAAAYTLMMGAQILPWMIATALTPVFARTHHRDAAEFEASWHRGLRLVLLISLPIALVTSLLADGIIARFFGSEFEASVDVLALIIWICPLGAVSLIAQAALRGAGRERWLTIVSGACAALNVGLNLWAIPRYGIMGAAVVTVATELLNMVALSAASLRAGIVPWPRLPLLGMTVALAALAATALLLSGVPVELAALAALLAYGLVLRAFGVVGAAELAAVAGLVRRRA